MLTTVTAAAVISPDNKTPEMRLQRVWEVLELEEYEGTLY